MMSRRRAPTARRTPISRVRSSTLASMMFMMPMPPTSSEIDAMATITTSKMRRVRCCSASSSAGTTTVKSPALAVRGVEQAPHERAGGVDVGAGLEVQVDAVDLVLLLALRILQPQDRRHAAARR